MLKVKFRHSSASCPTNSLNSAQRKSNLIRPFLQFCGGAWAALARVQLYLLPTNFSAVLQCFFTLLLFLRYQFYYHFNADEQCGKLNRGRLKEHLQCGVLLTLSEIT